MEFTQAQIQLNKLYGEIHGVIEVLNRKAGNKIKAIILKEVRKLFGRDISAFPKSKFHCWVADKDFIVEIPAVCIHPKKKYKGIVLVLFPKGLYLFNMDRNLPVLNGAEHEVDEQTYFDYGAEVLNALYEEYKKAKSTAEKSL